jgi:hypothetical protein
LEDSNGFPNSKIQRREFISLCPLSDRGILLDFVLATVASNQFANGNYLIVDNAAVHHGLATYDLIVTALDSVSCKLIFLPAYSPELNP